MGASVAPLAGACAISSDRREATRAWASRHGPELAIVALGVALRWSMRTNYDHTWSYDFADHLGLIRWVAHTFRLAPLDVSREAYHPPLYYFLAGAVMRMGAGEARFGTISIVCGALRLLVLWAVFARWLGRSSLATRVALLVAALQPTSIHLDGMTTGEGLSNLEAAVAMWVMPPLFAIGASATARSRATRDWSNLPWRRALGLGLVLALALLTKVSALSIFAAIALGLLARLLWMARATLRTSGARRRSTPPGGLRQLVAAWLIVAIAVACVSGWYLVRNHRLYGKFFLSGFDGPDKVLMDSVSKTPLLSRRPPQYYWCWSNDIYRYPYYPSGVEPTSCFWPQLVVSSWVDFYRYGFSNGKAAGALRVPIFQTARASVAGGTVLGLCATITTMLLLVWAWRRRNAAALALLLMPVVALCGQLYFATAFPADSQGMVKGLYMQFASPPLYGTIGVAVGWLWRFRLSKPLAIAVMASLAMVGSYAVTCRFLPAPAAARAAGAG